MVFDDMDEQFEEEIPNGRKHEMFDSDNKICPYQQPFNYFTVFNQPDILHTMHTMHSSFV